MTEQAGKLNAGSASKSVRLDTILCLIVAAASAFAVARHPYGYYQILRWGVCGMGAYIAFRLSAAGRSAFALVFVSLAVLFNPILPIRLTREIWEPVNLACAAAFAVASYFTTRLKASAH